jgi:hypothetical protein
MSLLFLFLTTGVISYYLLHVLKYYHAYSINIILQSISSHLLVYKQNNNNKNN